LKEVNLKNYNNDWYKPGNSLRILIWMFVSAIFFRISLPLPIKIKIYFLKLFGAKVGTGVVIKPGVNIKYPWKLSIGDNTWIGESVWIDNLAPIFIGSNCCVSQGAYLLTGNHDFSKVTFDLIISEIHLNDGSWIGAKSVVCPGVIVHSGAILTVNSVITKNMDELGIYQGNPAIKIKQRNIK